MSHQDPPGDRSRSPGTSDDFFRLVYDELRSIAHARKRRSDTMQSTELVHEAYLRLRKSDGTPWENRAHFFAAAAEAMRRILIERARARGRVKRGGDAEGRPPVRVTLNLEELASIADDRDPEAILAMDRAIEKLAAQEDRVAHVVKLRFWAGLAIEEIAEVLELSPRTVLRDWAFARAWLYRELGPDAPSTSSSSGG